MAVHVKHGGAFAGMGNSACRHAHVSGRRFGQRSIASWKVEHRVRNHESRHCWEGSSC